MRIKCKLLSNTQVYANLKIWVILFCLLSSQSLHALEQIQLSIKQLLPFIPEKITLDSTNTDKSKKQKSVTKQDSFDIEDITVILDISSDPVSLAIDLSQARLPQPWNALTHAKFNCTDFKFNTHSVSCDKGKFSSDGLIAGNAKIQGEFKFNHSLIANEFQFEILMKINRDSTLALHFKKNDKSWSTDINGHNIQLKTFNEIIEHYLVAHQIQLEDLQAQLNFNLSLKGSVKTETLKQQFVLKTINLNGHFEHIAYQLGDNLAENLGLAIQLNIDQTKDQKRYLVDLNVSELTGELLQNEVYLQFTGQENLASFFTYYSEQNNVNFRQLMLDVKDVFNIELHGLVNLDDINENSDYHLSIKFSDLARFNELYLQSALEGSDYQDINLKGDLTLTIENKNKFFNIATQANHFDLDYQKKFVLSGVSGKAYWNNYPQTQKPVNDSELIWQSGMLSQLPIGETTLKFKAHNDQAMLLKNLEIPIFDGALLLNQLHITQITQSDSGQTPNKPMTVTIDGLIKPISLSKLSAHFKWPLLDGRLSAVIPSTTYNKDALRVGGAMLLQVFDGVIVIKDLAIENPLEDYARLSANVDLNNINLQSLTRTYNFGEIWGMVEGKIIGLVLESWQPVAFNAYIRTPKNDKSDHRISQRAIDNLSSLGGVSGLLSKSFLSFFETFGYDKIGLSCHLKNNICTMNGVESKGNSYYIVKGGGIPRIDVMGFENQVNWKVLTERLSSIRSANEAVIK